MESILREIDKLLREAGGGPSPVLVGIDGKGGAGKSTLARMIASRLPSAVVIEMDDFYFPSAQRPNDPATVASNFDLERVIQQVLEPASSGLSCAYQKYDWDNDRAGEWIHVKDAAVILLEGVYSTCNRIRPFLSLCIWVETPRASRLSRGIHRDGESMRSMWTDVWMPAEDSYVSTESPDARASIVVSGDPSTPHFPTLEQR